MGLFILAFLLFLNLLLLIQDVIFGHVDKRQHYKHLKSENRVEEKNSIDRKKKKRDTLKAYVRYSLPIGAVVFVITYIVFQNVAVAILGSLVSFYYPKLRMVKNTGKRKELFTYQFREMLFSVSNSLKAGASLQSALERSLLDLSEVYKNQIDKPVIEELEIVVYDIKIGKSIEEALIEFKERVKIEDVTSFVNAAVITSKTGGNLTEVMSNVATIIGDKIQIKREIHTLTAAKRAEAKILTFMPILLVLILAFIAPSYMEPMYNTFIGKILMLIGAILVSANYFIGKKIVDIDV